MKRTASFLLTVLIMVSAFSVNVLAKYENSHVNTGDMAYDLINVAKTQLGYLEGSLDGSVLVSNNISKYGEWYGINSGAWCAMFISWCADQAGIPRTVIPCHASCDIGMEWFKDKGQWYFSKYFSGTYKPSAGDIAYFGSDPGNIHDSTHVGIVYDCDEKYIYTIEGNVSDMCKTVKHLIDSSYILGYGVPKYENSNKAPETVKLPETAKPSETATGEKKPASSNSGAGTTSTVKEKTIFDDVDKNAYYYKAVKYFFDNKVIFGAGNNKFFPMETLTRGMFVTIVGRMYESSGGIMESGSCLTSFSDLADGAYYLKYVEWAAVNGIVDGYSADVFAPDDLLSREQMIKIIYKYASLVGYKGQDFGATVDKYSDAAYISVWALQPVAWAVRRGLMSEISGDALIPQAAAKRAEAAQILYNCLW